MAESMDFMNLMNDFMNLEEKLKFQAYCANCGNDHEDMEVEILIPGLSFGA